MWLQQLFSRILRRPKPNSVSSSVPVTDEIIEFLITPPDLEVSSDQFDHLMTPDSEPWTKGLKNNWPYYQIGEANLTYSWEPPGIQMAFSGNITRQKAKKIAEEVVAKLRIYTDLDLQLITIPENQIINSDMRVHATFQIKAAFQVTGRQFYIIGDLLSGTIRKGMLVDLTAVGIPKKFTIEAIDYALHRTPEKVWEEPGLGLSGLTDPEKKLLRTGSPFVIPVSIEE